MPTFVQVMDQICLLRKQAFCAGTHFCLGADVPAIEMFLPCLTHCYLSPLRFGSKERGQEPSAPGSGCPILILRAVVSLPSVCAGEKVCKDKFPLLSVAAGPQWLPGFSRRRTKVASEADEFWLCDCLEKQYSLGCWWLMAGCWSPQWHRTVC